MNKDTHRQKRAAVLVSLLVGIAAAAAAIAVSTMVAGNRFIQKLPDNWMPTQYTAPELAVLALSALSGVFLALFASEASFRPLAVYRRDLNWAWVIGIVNLALLVWAMVLLIEYRLTFRILMAEMGAISLAQPVLILIALGLLLRITLAAPYRYVPPVFGLRFQLAAAAMTFVIFLLLMEEISYGQHFFGWQTPQAFSANLQNETNLHNFYTHQFEVAYYAGATLVFCILPIWAGCSQWSLFAGARHIIPPPAFGAAALPLISYNYETWGIVPLQIQFFVGIALALVLFIRFEGEAKRLPVLALALILACQVIFLLKGHKFILGWELTEMRELAIAWMILCYALWLTRHLRSTAAPIVSSGK